MPIDAVEPIRVCQRNGRRSSGVRQMPVLRARWASKVRGICRAAAPSPRAPWYHQIPAPLCSASVARTPAGCTHHLCGVRASHRSVAPLQGWVGASSTRRYSTALDTGAANRSAAAATGDGSGATAHAHGDPATSGGRGRFVPLEKSHLLRALIQDGYLAGAADPTPLIQAATHMDTVIHFVYVRGVLWDHMHAEAELDWRWWWWWFEGVGSHKDRARRIVARYGPFDPDRESLLMEDEHGMEDCDQAELLDDLAFMVSSWVVVIIVWLCACVCGCGCGCL